QIANEGAVAGRQRAADRSRADRAAAAGTDTVGNAHQVQSASHLHAFRGIIVSGIGCAVLEVAVLAADRINIAVIDGSDRVLGARRHHSVSRCPGADRAVAANLREVNRRYRTAGECTAAQVVNVAVGYYHSASG